MRASVFMLAGAGAAFAQVVTQISDGQIQAPQYTPSSEVSAPAYSSIASPVESSVAPSIPVAYTSAPAYSSAAPVESSSEAAPVTASSAESIPAYTTAVIASVANVTSTAVVAPVYTSAPVVGVNSTVPYGNTSMLTTASAASSTEGGAVSGSAATSAVAPIQSATGAANALQVSVGVVGAFAGLIAFFA